MTYVSPHKPWSRAQRERYPLRDGFKRNTGSCPREAHGKRVIVALMTGEIADLGESWPADGKGGASWKLDGSPFNIDQYRVV